MDSAPEEVTLRGGPALAIREQMPMSALPAFFARAFAELAACAGDQVAGPPFARYYSVAPKRVDVEAVLPLTAPVSVSGRIHLITLVGGPAIQLRFVGRYEDIGEAYATLEFWIATHDRDQVEAVREVYLTGPDTPPNEHVTLVVQPLKPVKVAETSAESR